MHFGRPVLLGVLPMLIVACGSDSEDDEKFSEHYAIGELNTTYGAFAEDGRLKVYAALLGTKGFVRLRGGDTIEVDIDGTRVPTTERLLDDKVHYIADIAEPTGESAVTITFARGLDRVSKSVKLYSSFSVPSPPTSVTLGSGIEVDVDPRPDLSKWPGFFGPSLVGKAELVGECLGSQQIDLCAESSAPGKCEQSYPLHLDTTKLTTTLSTNRGCSVTVKVRLVSTAVADASTGPSKATFKGGGFDAHRGVTLSMQLLPK